MKGKSPNQLQTNIFSPLLSDFIDMGHELVKLGDRLDWKYFEKEFAPLYSNVGKPAVPVRMMVGCLLLKQMHNLGDETLAKAWVRDPYMQYFCGEAHFQHRFPFDPSDFVHFRKRIGEEGFEKIFRQSVLIHGKDGQEKVQMSDTTVQSNNITFPTDAKLYKKIIDRCNKIATENGLQQRQTYVRISKQLLRDCYNPNHPKRKKKARASLGKLRTIAGRMVREIMRELPTQVLETLKAEIEIFGKILTQTKSSSNKIYSLHKPFTQCISKGKAHKPYEFGHKVGITIGLKKLIITSVQTFEENLHDSKTIEPLIGQMERNNLKKPVEIVYDRGGRGKSEIKGVKISTPNKPLKTDSQYQKNKKRKKFRRRAAIEPVIGHLKSELRMAENYLLSKSSLKFNALLSATAWNLKKWMQNAISWLQKLFEQGTLSYFVTAYSSILNSVHLILYSNIKIYSLFCAKN